jgi:diaminopimelate decarboxylase
LKKPSLTSLNSIPVSPFTYRDDNLTCENVPLSAIADACGTPVYVYSRRELLSRASEFRWTLAKYSGNSLVCYAVKANGNPVLLRLLGEAGLGADVTSGGELYLAQQAGIEPGKIIFSGVGKKEDEIAEALLAGIRALHVESEMECGVVAEIAGRLGITAPIGVRVNPNISAETHPYISTGLHGHKFGVPRDRAIAILREAAADTRLKPIGLAAHIGSQITDLEPYAQSIRFLVDLAAEMRTEGIELDYIDAGGGLGIDYDTEAPAVSDWINTVAPLVFDAGFDLVMEPGRSIAGPSGALLARVIYTKKQGNKQFIIVDAGMTDLIRPTLYQAYHPILPVSERRGEPEMVDVVGPICETSDFLARDRILPPLARNDLVAVLHAGAYGFAMSSNYNGHLRPAEVLVEDDCFRIIRRRQTYQDLLLGT